MQVFTVNKWFRNYDSNHYHEWIESEIVSYHATLEGANTKISSFPDKDEKITDEYDGAYPIYFVSSIVVED